MTEQQINQIVVNIDTVLSNARDCIRGLEELCDADYLQGREQYLITALVYTAFNVEEQNIPGLTIQKVLYGGKKKMYLPVLFNNETCIEVFGDTSKPWTTNEVRMKYELMGNRFNLLIFSVDREQYRLQKLQLLSFDSITNKGYAHISNRVTIYRRNGL